MENPVKAIYKFQKDAGLLDNGYDDFLESSFQIEEALEGFDIISVSESTTNYNCSTSSAKEFSRYILDGEKFQGTDVDRLDKACDAVVYAIGSMAKLGLNPQQITKALNVVNHHNRQKLSMPRDEHGKLLKPEGFVGPEPELQKILDER